MLAISHIYLVNFHGDTSIHFSLHSFMHFHTIWAFLLFLLFLPNINMQDEKICTPDDKFQGDTFTHSHTFPNVSNILGYFSGFSPIPTNWRPPSSTLQELERGAPGRPDILERSKYLLNQENMPDFSEHIIWPEHSSLHACTLCACMQGPISQPNWVGSERSKYLWNWDNMPDLSGHKILPEHTNLCACTLYACMLGLIYQPNWCLHVQAHISAKLGRIRNIKVSMESGEHSGPVWAHMTQARKLACMHTMCLHARGHPTLHRS